MDFINPTLTDRYPLSTDTIAFIQDMLRTTAQLALIGGEKYILSGCVKNGGNVSAGMLVINGEPIPFSGGTEVDTITVVEAPETITAAGLTFPKARVRRYARFATGTGANYYPWADFKPLATNRQLDEAKASIKYVDDEIKKISVGAIKPGIIALWNGTEASIPEGWCLCDGREISPGRFAPPLCGCFVVGYNRQDEDYNQIGKTGGTKTVTLTKEQLPAHAHELDDYFHFDNSGVDFNSFGAKSIIVGEGEGVRNGGERADTMYYKTHDTKETGAGAPVESRPPYYVLAYIVKI